MVADNTTDPQTSKQASIPQDILPEIPSFNEKDISNKDIGRDVAAKFYAIIIKQKEIMDKQLKDIENLKIKLKYANDNQTTLKNQNDLLKEENNKLQEEINNQWV